MGMTFSVGAEFFVAQGYCEQVESHPLECVLGHGSEGTPKNSWFAVGVDLPFSPKGLVLYNYYVLLCLICIFMIFLPLFQLKKNI